MGALVLDTSVVIGFLQPNDTHHGPAVHEIAAARQRADRIMLPVSVLAETLVGEYRSGTAAGDDLGDGLLTMFGPERVIDDAVARAAARLRARHRSLRLPDALVIATGIVEDAIVLTCDRRLGPVHEKVQVIGHG